METCANDGAIEQIIFMGNNTKRRETESAAMRGSSKSLAHAADVSCFQPTSARAQRKLEFFLERGALVMSAAATVVRVMQAGRVALIDKRGKVTWVG